MRRFSIEWNLGHPDKDFLIGLSYIPNVQVIKVEDEENEEGLNNEIFNIDVLSIGVLIFKLNIITKWEKIN